MLDQRGQRYGNYAQMAEVIQELKHAATGPNLSAIHQEALDMICTKIGRIITGDPNHIDSWEDIAGYATLVVIELRKQAATGSGPVGGD